MNTEDILNLINDIRNARADVESLKDDEQALEMKRDKINDRLEGIADDIRSGEANIQVLEEDLLAITREEPLDYVARDNMNDDLLEDEEDFFMTPAKE